MNIKMSMGGRLKNTKAIKHISDGLGNINSLNSEQDLRNISIFREEIGKILGLKPTYFEYILRKHNNTLTDYDNFWISESDQQNMVNNLVKIKDNTDAMAKVDNIINKFIIICKRNTRKRMLLNFNNTKPHPNEFIIPGGKRKPDIDKMLNIGFNKPINADTLISWLID